MKRKPSPSLSAMHTTTTTRKQPRQDPVSCESCRKKKLKCDRNQPCSSCSVRKLVCSYGSYGHGAPSPGVKSDSQSEQRPTDANSDDRSTRRLPLPSSSPLQAQPQSRSDRNDPLVTADWLETIVMAHRVPSAAPIPLRDGLTHHQRLEFPQPCLGTIPGNLLTLVRGGRIVSNENPANIHLPALLPSEPEALDLLAYYFNHLDYQYHLVVASRTERDIHAIYESAARNEPVNLHHLALLFSIIASALFYQLLPTESADFADICSSEAAFLAGAALIQANYIAYPSIEGLQATMIIGHHLSSNTLSPLVSSFFVHGSLVSQAKALRLHAMDNESHSEERKRTGYDKTEVELKRRLWWDLASYDWLIGFLSGPQQWTYTIHPNNMNVRRPLNIKDEDLDSIETGQPLSTPTCMSYTHARLRLAEVCREIVDKVGPEHLHGQDVPYEKILELDRKLHDAHAELPIFFRYDKIARRDYSDLYRERPAIAWQRAFIQQGFHSRLCRLHRQYFVRGARDPRYSYSHVVSLQSARKVLEVKRIMDEEEPFFTPNSSFFWAVMHHVFMAAVILLIDVCFNWDDILAEKRKEEVIAACRMLSRAQQSSSVAREGINAMMGILQKHWKQEKRLAAQTEPSARGPDVPSSSNAQPQPQSQAQPQPMMSASTMHGVGVKNSYFSPSQPFPIPSQNYEAVNPAAFIPLEDIWTEMLDGSAHAGLDTPGWIDMLTELNNTTAPCE
ncbi:hypothetical protein N7481_007093 [Penicillium waksmanii]|uniref:uncharacterized protein n=1 Tax=Penicillium waksmanii TaxID=69791 RepID=UPI0025476A8B|nr:uncharacterized protein N7481_007093 [Penicillium waksmanii]KAJ5979795.1 hypothetical protein N7481_007093 [Penicillium waksmanii]